MNPAIDWAAIRADFPLLTREVHDKPLVYLDSANTGQKPASVIQTVDDFYRQHNANVSRAVHTLGTEATDAYEGARKRLARFLNVRPDELVLCSGTTFAINLVAYSWALPRLKAGDTILVSRMEHHANIVPWQLVAQRTGATLKVAEIHADGQTYRIPPAHERRVTDPTGCGDAFRAGLIFGIGKGYDWMTIGRMGNLMGALKVEHPGTQNQRFDYEEFAEQFRQQFGYALA